ncbi:MAG: hypothetical protein JXR76_00565 [Deltaproteobacteria bacterium]|nr:hypothetical protein [Deltaproteobacteria bacterium]
MRKQFCVLAATIIAGVMLIGAKGCEVTADTNKVAYVVADEGMTTIYNQTLDTVFLPGCSRFNFEKRDGEKWIDYGPNVICVQEGIGIPLTSGNDLATQFNAPTEVGEWRLHYVISKGCKQGLPLSKANCTGTEDIYTAPFNVMPLPEPTCDDLAGEDFGPCEMVLGWAVVDGTCQLVSGCGANGVAFFENETACLSACAKGCSQWRVAYVREANRIAACNDASECEAVKGTSCGCTRNLVANMNADKTDFFALLKAMSAAGCGIVTTCDCPAADGYVCDNGMCDWNYL